MIFTDNFTKPQYSENKSVRMFGVDEVVVKPGNLAARIFTVGRSTCTGIGIGLKGPEANVGIVGHLSGGYTDLATYSEKFYRIKSTLDFLYKPNSFSKGLILIGVAEHIFGADAEIEYYKKKFAEFFGSFPVTIEARKLQAMKPGQIGFIIQPPDSTAYCEGIIVGVGGFNF